MALNDKIALLHAELTQRQLVCNALTLLQKARTTILEIDMQIQEISDTGNFATLNAEVKHAMLKAHDVIKAAKLGFKDSTVASLLDWSSV